MGFGIVFGDKDAFGIGCCSAGPGDDAATPWDVVEFWDLAQRVERAVPGGARRCPAVPSR